MLGAGKVALEARCSYHQWSVNLYEALGVAPQSEAPEIRRAYLASARECHPDFHVNADEATRTRNARRMQAVNQAWEVLGDPVRRADYDRALANLDDPGVARRAAREPDMPAGKGWTPRAGDDGWMTDFDAWADEHEVLPPDVRRSASRDLVTLLPMGLAIAAVLLGFVGLAVQLAELVAIAAVCLIFSAGLFLMLPMFAMSRGRKR